MKNRFDLENEISGIYSFSDQLATLSEAILEERLTTDQTVNAIEGIKVMLELQTQKLLDTMCQCFKLDGYKSLENIEEVAY